MGVFNLTEPEKAYIAGFFDGEGHFSCCRDKRRKRYSGWELGITNTDKEVLLWIKSKVGGKVRQMTGKSRKKHWKVTWRWYLCDKIKIIEFYKLILPYLRVKK